MLAQLASHYWRPDYSPAQSAALTADYAEDLANCTIAEIENAIRDYRRDGANQFFPKVGQLLGIIEEDRKHRSIVHPVGPRLVPEYGGTPRPMMWWCKPPCLWQQDWQESEIPEEHRSAFAARLKAKRAAGEDGWAVADFARIARQQQHAAE